MPVNAVLRGNDHDAIGEVKEGVSTRIWGNCMDQRDGGLHEGLLEGYGGQ